MNRASVIALVLAGILFGCAVGMVAHGVVESEASAEVKSKKVKWVYFCERFRQKKINKDQTRLDEIGKQGWEMVSMAPVGEGSVWTDRVDICFKHPVK